MSVPGADMLPFPIAFPYHLIDAARTPADRYLRLLLCFEAVLRYLATVQLSDYQAADCPDPKLNGRLLDLLAQKRLAGHWVEMIREVARLQHAGRFEPFMPEIPRLYFGTRNKPQFTPAAELLDSVLLSARNNWAHPDRTPPADVAAERLKEHRPLLDRLLAALDFLARYPLYVPTTGTPQGVVTAAVHLAGPTDPPRYVEGLNIPLAPRVRDRLEYDSSAIVCDPDDPARQLLLGPLALFVSRDAEEDIFLFQNCKVNGPKVAELHYHAVRVNQEPLHIKPGEGFDVVVAQFGELLGRLSGGPGDAPHPGPPLAASRVRRRWPLVAGATTLLAVLIGLVFAVRAFAPAAGPSPTTPTSASVDHPPLSGSVDLLVYRVDHTGSDKLVPLDHPLALPLRAGDHFKVAAELNRPAYLYLFWTDENGNTVPMHPWVPGKWGTRPNDEKPSAQLDLVAPNGNGFKVTGDASGMETILMIALNEKLTATDDEVKGWFAGLKPLPFRGEQARVWFENFDVVRFDVKRAFTIDGDVDAADGPVGLQRAVKGKVSGVDFSRAISFARVGKSPGD